MSKVYLAVAILGWAFWAFACKIVATKTSPMVMQLSSYIIGFFCLPLFWFLLKQDKPIAFTWSTIGLAIVGASSGIIAYIAYTYALRTGNAGITTITVSAIYPALTLILSMLFLGETLTVLKVCGLVSIFLGVLLLAH